MISLAASRAFENSRHSWPESPYRLLSLGDIVESIRASLLFMHSRDIALQIGMMNIWIAKGQGDLRVSSDGLTPLRNELGEVLGALLERREELPIKWQMRTKIERLQQRVLSDQTLTVAQVELLCKELDNDIIAALAEPWFLMIPSERREFYEQRTPPFGMDVANQFPATIRDIAAASRCMALDEWTAAVFHLMRVLERGLHRFAGIVGLPMSDDIELANWKNIIDQIEAKLREMEQTQPKGAAKSERLQLYAQAASGFWQFKEAWRNHVAHSRATYDEPDAWSIWQNVRDFMVHLATRLPEVSQGA
jgi:hypothetical protein